MRHIPNLRVGDVFLCSLEASIARLRHFQHGMYCPKMRNVHPSKEKIDATPYGVIFVYGRTPFGIIKTVISMVYERIRNLREDSDLTQQQLADYLHMQRSVYRRYELGEREIPVWALVKLAKLYKTSTDYILGLRSDR